MAAKKQRTLDPASFFLIAGLCVGLLYCVIVPYGAGFDEERHLARMYYMSQYHFLPNFPNPTIHEALADLSYQRRITQSPAFDMFSREKFGLRFSASDQLRYGQRTQSIYSPVMFLPQALIGRLLWWKYDFPILPTIILQKIAGLLMYIAGAYAAIRAAPFGKWIFTALALSPAALYQAATLNADGFTAAVSFAFIGWVLAVYMNERAGLQLRSIWILSALSILLGAAKPGAIVLLPLLLILLRHPFPSKKWTAFLGAGVLLAVAANVGWWALASQGSVFAEGGAQSVSQQSSMLLVDPLGFLTLLVQGLVLTLPSQLQGWLAAYGYWAGTVPGQVYFFSAIFLLAAFFAEPQRVQIPAGTRIFIVGVGLLSCAAIYGIAFAANYVTGGVLALAKHGRYYIPFAPLFFLGLTGLLVVRENLQSALKSVAVAAFLCAAVYYTFGIYTAYYTYCGYEAYTGATCGLPIYKNLEKAGPQVEINDGERLRQTFTNQCGQLEMVQVFVSAIPSAGSLKFAVFDEAHHALASRSFAVHEIPAFEYLSLPVELPSDYENKNFVIELEATDLPVLDTFRFALSPTDAYPGLLLVDDRTTPGDLIIHYICAGP